MTEASQAKFTETDRTRYYNETFESLEALLVDAIEGEDHNDIKGAFPENSALSDIEVANYRVSLSFYNEEVGIIEVIIQIAFQNEVIGEYTSIYNLEGELEDETFYIE